jgi:hypothetical protein
MGPAAIRAMVGVFVYSFSNEQGKGKRGEIEMTFFIGRKMHHALLITCLMACFMAVSACGAGTGQVAASSVAASSPSQATATPNGTGLTASLRLAQPGLLLKRLQPLVGTWRTRMTVTQTPESAPVTSTDITTNLQWVNNGTFLQEEMTGQLGGTAYYRLGFMTYNNLDQRYEFITMDHVDTGFMIYYSVANDPGNSLTMYGRFTEGGSGPTLVGQEVKIRYVIRWVNNESFSEDMYFTRPAAPEYLAVQYTLTRQK